MATRAGSVSACIDRAGGAVEEATAGFEEGRHLRDLGLDDLELRKGGPESPSFLHMGDGLLEGALGSADGEGSAPVETGTVEELHELVETLPFCSDEVFPRDPHVLEGNLSRIGASDGELAVEFVRLIPRSVRFYDDRAHPVVRFRVLRVGEAEYDEVVARRSRW